MNQINDQQVSNFQEMPLDEFSEYIVQKHHTYLNNVLPQIQELTKIIAKVHGSEHPELKSVSKLASTFKSNLESYLYKEKKQQFSGIKTYLETHDQAILESIIKMIDELQAEQQELFAILKSLRMLTHDYSTPEDTCPTYRKTYELLKEMEADIFIHFHHENEFLYPRLMHLNTA